MHIHNIDGRVCSGCEWMGCQGPFWQGRSVTNRKLCYRKRTLCSCAPAPCSLPTGLSSCVLPRSTTAEHPSATTYVICIYVIYAHISTHNTLGWQRPSMYMIHACGDVCTPHASKQCWFSFPLSRFHAPCCVSITVLMRRAIVWLVLVCDSRVCHFGMQEQARIAKPPTCGVKIVPCPVHVFVKVKIMCPPYVAPLHGRSVINFPMYVYVVYVCVCVCMCIHTYICMFIYICIHTRTYLCMCVS